MEPHEDARLRLAALRHPAARVVGTLHLAQHRLTEATRAFVTVMAAAGHPGARPLPPPGGRHRWPRGHGARGAEGWLVPVAVEQSFRCWLDTAGQWWMIRYDDQARPLDAHTVGTPLRTAADLHGFRVAFEQLLADGGVPR
jgi:hypothetical protein